MTGDEVIMNRRELLDALVAKFLKSAPGQQADQPPACLPPERGLTAEPDPDDSSHVSSVAHIDGSGGGDG